MEENKKCCENGACGNCKDKKGMCCWHGKCHVIKMLLLVILIIFSICLGVMIGSHRNGFRERGERFSDKVSEIGKNLGNSGSGSVTVKVLPPETSASGTTTPPVAQ